MLDYVRQFEIFHLIQMFSYFSTNIDFVYLCWNDASMHSFVLVSSAFDFLSLSHQETTHCFVYIIDIVTNKEYRRKHAPYIED